MQYVGLVSRFQANPKDIHVNVVKGVFKYLQVTLDYGLWYLKGKHFNLITYTNVDWVGSIDDRKITLGETYFLGGFLVSWEIKKKITISLCIVEVEYVVVTMCYNYILWMKKTLKAMNIEYNDPISIMVDNTSAISISRILFFIPRPSTYRSSMIF